MEKNISNRTLESLTKSNPSNGSETRSIGNPKPVRTTANPPKKKQLIYNYDLNFFININVNVRIDIFS